MDIQYVRDNYYRSGGDALPRWMHNTRFEKLYILDRWLAGTFYDAIPLAFDEEQINGHYNLMRTRRPATKDHWPAQIAGLTARKLFGGRHVPRIKHKDKQFAIKVLALAKELNLFAKFLEAVKRGSVGSVLVLFKFLTQPERAATNEEIEAGIDAPIKVKGVVNVKQTQYCTPVFNEFEELIGVMEHYVVKGKELIKRGLVKDRDNEDVLPGDNYWFVKMLDTQQEVVFYPLKKNKWNPVEGSADYKTALVDYPLVNETGEPLNPFIHGLGFVQGVWIQNLVGGTAPEGLSTWELALDNFMTLDYQKSQNDRGLKYGSAPQLVIKGDLRDEANGEEKQPVYRSPSYEIRVAADEKGMDGQSASTGHDAKLLETNGMASKASDEFTQHLKHSTFEQISAARKDLESISGTMSGKAIELIDEDYVDLVQELRLQYGDNGFLPFLKKLCKAAAVAGHPLMDGANDKLIDGLDLDYPPMYLPDPQEFNFLADGFAKLCTPPQITSKSADGSSSTQILEPVLDAKIANEYLAKQLDLVEESFDRPVINDTQVDSDNPADPPVEDELLNEQQSADLETGLTDNLSAGRRLLRGRDK